MRIEKGIVAGGEKASSEAAGIALRAIHGIPRRHIATPVVHDEQIDGGFGESYPVLPAEASYVTVPGISYAGEIPTPVKSQALPNNVRNLPA